MVLPSSVLLDDVTPGVGHSSGGPDRARRAHGLDQRVAPVRRATAGISLPQRHRHHTVHQQWESRPDSSPGAASNGVQQAAPQQAGPVGALLAAPGRRWTGVKDPCQPLHTRRSPARGWRIDHSFRQCGRQPALCLVPRNPAPRHVPAGNKLVWQRMCADSAGVARSDGFRRGRRPAGSHQR